MSRLPFSFGRDIQQLAFDLFRLGGNGLGLLPDGLSEGIGVDDLHAAAKA